MSGQKQSVSFTDVAYDYAKGLVEVGEYPDVSAAVSGELVRVKANREREASLFEAELRRRLALPLDRWEPVGDASDVTPDDAAVEGGSLVRPALVVAATALYILAFRPVGYALSSALYVAALLVIFGFQTRRPLRLALATAGITILFFGLFAGIFGVRLPPFPSTE